MEENNLINRLVANLSDSLEISTLGRCSRWAEKVRVMPGNPPLGGKWSFTYHPWLRELHDATHEFIFIKKAAQMGVTEYALNRSLYTVDQLKQNVLYIFPNERPAAMRFSKEKLKPAVDGSPYIKSLFCKADSELIKVSKHDRLFTMAGCSRTSLKSYSAGLVVLDELDEMSDEGITLALQRTDGQPGNLKQHIGLSTPSIDGKGIDKFFEDTTQDYYFFKCPHCSKLVTLFYPECLVITADDPKDIRIKDSYICCPECRKELKHSEKPAILANGTWVSKYPLRLRHGYHISQLFSTQLDPWIIAEHALRAEFDTIAKTELYNSRLGETFVADGAKLTDSVLKDAQRDYLNLSEDIDKVGNYKLITMGIDVGQSSHHLVVCGWRLMPGRGRNILEASEGRVLLFKKVSDTADSTAFQKIEALMRRWKPRMTIIDAQPDLNNASALAKKFASHCYACYYSTSKNTKAITVRAAKDEEGEADGNSISVNRSFWLGQTFDFITKGLMGLPKDLDLEFKENLKSTVKVYKLDDKQNVFCDFVKKDGTPDHYLHALNYAVIALGKSAGGGQTQYMEDE